MSDDAHPVVRAIREFSSKGGHRSTCIQAKLEYTLFPSHPEAAKESGVIVFDCGPIEYRRPQGGDREEKFGRFRKVMEDLIQIVGEGGAAGVNSCENAQANVRDGAAKWAVRFYKKGVFHYCVGKPPTAWIRFNSIGNAPDYGLLAVSFRLDDANLSRITTAHDYLAELVGGKSGRE